MATVDHDAIHDHDQHDHHHNDVDDAVLLLFLRQLNDDHDDEHNKKQNSFGLHIKIPKGYRTFDIIKHLYSAFCLVCVRARISSSYH